jgi:hypothetical protein
VREASSYRIGEPFFAEWIRRDIGTGEDLYSCAVDHWLPEPVWRVVNP